ncbi:hypothetical protein [Dactylococcopsis salina]|nr:hypothetical protein [Dactylococcopsis salina]
MMVKLNKPVVVGWVETFHGTSVHETQHQSVIGHWSLVTGNQEVRSEK